MGTAVSAKQVLDSKEERVIPRALQIVFHALKKIVEEYDALLKVQFSRNDGACRVLRCPMQKISSFTHKIEKLMLSSSQDICYTLPSTSSFNAAYNSSKMQSLIIRC